MKRIASPIEDIRPDYDVVVIGTGYGGAIAASRMSRAGRKVCVLERGRELIPGEYPDTAIEAAGEMQARVEGGKQIGARTAMFDFRYNKDINVLVGCGMGGTSLINANVSLPPEPRVFDDECWPQSFKDDVKTSLQKGFQRAQEMLQPVFFPSHLTPPDKLNAMQKAAEYLGKECTRLPINVAFYDMPGGKNHVGVTQPPCTLCGDCVSGCNVGAKGTTLMNYLPDAKNHGAELYECAEVQRLEKIGEQWLIHFKFLDSGRENFDAPLLTVKANMVILGAGTLGSTEILLRSRQAGLPISNHLGNRFTGNGDVLGFAYNADVPVNGIGFGAKDPKTCQTVGPCITSVIDLREQNRLEDGMVVEEGALPGAIGDLLPATFAAAAKVFGRDTDEGIVDFVQESRREMESLVRGPYTGAIKSTQTYLVMSHDDSAGNMSLDHDQVVVDWPKVGEQAIFDRINEQLAAVTSGIGGTYIHNPVWNKITDHQLITVHPLGGCAMADNANDGVVNHKGQVFSGNDGEQVYENLYVCDGSVIPRSLGVNPLLTISAIAERTCALIAEDRKWTINYDLPSRPQAKHSEHPIGIRFTETMRGHFSTAIKDNFEKAELRGKKDDSTLEFTLTIVANDLNKLLSEEGHKARMIGTLNAPALSTQACMVANGEFQLLTRSDNRVMTRNMHYRFKIRNENEKPYYFTGVKEISQDSGLDIWSDTTTLYVTIFEGEDDSAPVYGTGILHIQPQDFMKQLKTVQVTGSADTKQRLSAMAQFGRFFAGELFTVYGGVFVRPDADFYADAPPRKKRSLRSNAPEVYSVITEDNVKLRLTRYRGEGNHNSNKKPVLLSHGLGVSSNIFTIDTIETNLVEYLLAHGYDCWLLDYRASIELSLAKTQFSGDAIARYDYPAAVRKVKEMTDCESIDVIAHCFGSTTFTMAMLNGLQGVRSAVCSQVMSHIESPKLTKVKTGLHVPGLLDKLGIESLTAKAKTDQKWWQNAYDEALKVFPGNAHDNNPVSRRITFLYGSLYELDQLNSATYSALHEMFGVANISSFKHLALMVREGVVTTADGKNTYLPHMERLAIPITIIHGAENQCFLPKSTELTFDMLRKTNGTQLYNRHLIPGYGHIDCIFGKNAIDDVYPYILQHLDLVNR